MNALVPSRFETVVVEGVSPVVDGGRFPAKRQVGDDTAVEADVFSHGHELVAGAVHYRHCGEEVWREVDLELLDNDRYGASFPATTVGVYEFQVFAWPDPLATWHHGILRKAASGQTLTADLEVGARLAEVAAKRAKGKVRRKLRDFAALLRAPAPSTIDWIDELVTAGRRARDPDAVVTTPVFPVLVERPLAGCS